MSEHIPFGLQPGPGRESFLWSLDDDDRGYPHLVGLVSGLARGIVTAVVAASCTITCLGMLHSFDRDHVLDFRDGILGAMLTFGLVAMLQSAWFRRASPADFLRGGEPGEVERHAAPPDGVA